MTAIHSESIFNNSLSSISNETHVQDEEVLKILGRFYRIPEQDFNPSEEADNEKKKMIRKCYKKLNKFSKELKQRLRELSEISAKDRHELKGLYTDLASLYGENKGLEDVTNLCDRFPQTIAKLTTETKTAMEKGKETTMEKGKETGTETEPPSTGLISRWSSDKEDILRFQTEYWDAYNKWISASVTLLDNLAIDIQLAYNINVPAYNVLLFKEIQISVLFFLTKMNELCKASTDKDDKPSQELKSACEKVRAALEDFVSKFDQDCQHTIEPDAISSQGLPIKSIRELVVFNKISQTNLEGKLTLNRSANMQEVACEITKTLKSLFTDYQEFWHDTKSDIAWTPATIVVVLDSESGLLLTGGSQPQCRKHRLLGKKGSQIPHLQLGELFASTIRQCDKAWTTHCNIHLRPKYNIKGKIPPQVAIPYAPEPDAPEPDAPEPDALKPELRAQLPAANTGKIYCWALTAQLLELRAPCPRCEHFYRHSWELYKPDDYTDKAEKALINYLSSTHPDAREDNRFICAETIAAAQINLWRNR